MQQEILYTLHKYKDGYISGAELADKLGVTRTSIWNHIEYFRKQGYKIEAHPRLGYKLQEVPDRLLPDEIQWGLKTKTIGRNIWAYEEIDSTNNAAWGLAGNGVPAGSVVVAESQTSGRGRLGRNWFSPRRKGLWFSVILQPAIAPSSAAMITVGAAVAVAEAIARYTGLLTAIKWPNDIYINNKKAGGILVELNTELDKIKYAIVGIGVDVNLAKNDYPAALRKIATSLMIEGQKACSRIELLRGILTCLDSYCDLVERQEFPVIIEKWKNLSLVLGKRIKVIQGERRLQGQALGIDDRGGLIVRLDNGFNEHINSGDISLCC